MLYDTSQGLANQVDTAQWAWLREHQQRGVLLVVEALLDLVTVAERLAADDSTAVRGWLASGVLKKPDTAQVAAWDTQPDKPFAMLIVSPFVLIQESADGQQSLSLANN